MRLPLFSLYATLVVCLSSCQPTPNRIAPSSAARRSFQFRYDVVLSDFPPAAKKVRVWLPLPASDETQEIRNLRIEAPVSHQETRETIYGNRIAYFEVEEPSAPLPISISVDVSRVEVKAIKDLGGSPSRARLLQGDQVAPLTDEVKKRAEAATYGADSSVNDRARAIYDRVLADVDYDKSGEGWGRGDIAYVCDVGRGNCSDFHALFVGMARATGIPAIFEIGFPLPRATDAGAIAGYHCWAWYEGEDGVWRPVDASEADKAPERTDYFFGTICPNRVAFSRGRDLILEPPQAAGPVNFFIYPYVEVDGKPGAAKVEKSFSFKNLPRLGS